MLFASLSSQAKLVTVEDSLLSDDQRSLLETKTHVQQAAQWVGLGKEIGIAVNDGLSSLTDQANKFANTKVGTWTMILVTYKVLGKDFIRYAVGLLFFIVAVIILFWQFKAGYYAHKIRTKGNIFSPLFGNPEYQVIEPSDEQRAWSLGILVIGFIVALIATGMTMFG